MLLHILLLDTGKACNLAYIPQYSFDLTHCGDGHRSPEIQHCLGHLARKFDNDREPLRPPLHVPKIQSKMTSA